MIIATAGAATAAAWTASKLPEEAGPGVGADCTLPGVGRLAGPALAVAPGDDEEEDGIEIDGEQADASSSAPSPASTRAAAGLVVDRLGASIC
ncbi:hypothetical protein [Candidatus Nephthysia bennettiae]|uniref:Uncharacterized protein n=1 Tax=Candidatus Nephthysia bennettiae TaxID=3127016 RepID=A0A934NDI3_9BACT|nr:hypothetical protein [Candidatus Dormibacteraeota bacterium]MBJ7611507.1 hypothetical protein [Candidatus Dormibacteraeota bacterium]